MLFPYQPETPVAERLLFLSDVSVMKDGSEQRVALRVSPRQEFDFVILVEDGDRRKIENMLYGNLSAVWDVPVWTEPMVLATAATSGDDNVTVVSTDYTDVREGGKIVVWENENSWSVLEGIEITGSVLTGNTTLTKNFPAGTEVFALRPAVVKGKAGVKRYAVNLTKYDITFCVTDNLVVDMEDVSAFPSLNSRPVFNDANAIEGTLDEGWDRQVFIADGGTGVFKQTSYWQHSHRVSSKTFKSFGRQRLWEIRKALHWLRGRVRSFYLPSFGKDLNLQATIGSADTTIAVDNDGYTDLVQSDNYRNVIQIVLTNGTAYTRNITNAVETDEFTETLTLSSALGANVTVAQVARIQLLERVRMDTDELTITHDNANGQATVGFAVKAVDE